MMELVIACVVCGCVFYILKIVGGVFKGYYHKGKKVIYWEREKNIENSKCPQCGNVEKRILGWRIRG